MRERSIRCCLGMVLILLYLGCSLPQAVAANEEGKAIKFLVAASGSGKRLEGVDVLLISSESRSVGKTNILGVFSVKVEEIRKSGARALLFCSEGFFCGAIQIDSELFEYTEKYIELAPFAVR